MQTRWEKDMELYLLIGVLCGVAAALLAQNKGRSLAMGGVLGLLLGPLGLLIVAIAPADAGQVDDSAIRRGEARKCPSCAELVRADASRCRFCGADVLPVP